MENEVAILLTEHGADLTLTRPGTGGTYAPASGTVTGAGSPTTYTVRGVFIEYLDERIDNTLIEVGDRKLLLQALDIPVVPQMGDDVDGMQIVGPVRTVKSGATVLAYTAQTRA